MHLWVCRLDVRGTHVLPVCTLAAKLIQAVRNKKKILKASLQLFVEFLEVLQDCERTEAIATKKKWEQSMKVQYREVLLTVKGFLKR